MSLAWLPITGFSLEFCSGGGGNAKLGGVRRGEVVSDLHVHYTHVYWLLTKQFNV